MRLDLQEEGCGGNQHERRIDYHCCAIELKLVSNLCFISEPSKLLQSTKSNSCGSSRMGQEVIARVKYLPVFAVATSDLILMNSAALVDARCGRSESLDKTLFTFSVSCNYAHIETGLNLFNFMPANEMASERVNYFNPFVVENYRGPKENLVAERDGESTPGNHHHAFGEPVFKEARISECGKEEDSSKAENVGTLRSKEFAIRHERIFSRAQEKRAA